MILPISSHINLNFDKKKVWSIISKPENLNLVHPYCKKNIVLEWSNKSHKDSLEYLNGVKLFREFTRWEEENGYELLIGKKNGDKSKVIWEITGDEKSKLKITIYPHVFRKKNIFQYVFLYFFVLKPGLKKYLNSVLNGYNYYLVNQKAVPKNHFGHHKWFS